MRKNNNDDEYYTSEENAVSFFEKVVKPSGILKHKTILMPFSERGTPLQRVAERYHSHVICFEGDRDLWKQAESFEDVAVLDNPPFSLSVRIESHYIAEDVPFILFRSAVSYPKFLFKVENAGVIYENSKRGVRFEWGFAHHIAQDKHVQKHYPNLLDNLKHHDILEKNVPVGFSFYLTEYTFKIKTVSFGELCYPKKGDISFYLNRGVFDENSHMYIDDFGRIHFISEVRQEGTPEEYVK
ncbi:hypothetical protein [Listeria fleischmannii]|uniref:Uncharacterized protein n=1 Tax=Listeria fleischmannii FSL S10-1203 TaxID=1265822 RepID=W7DUZ3_9LIST|nr:hypothetical protein [Listeria fleischmannii]EUJ59544.1 hypothetical protein MCOL2_05550 [Listeria fleischmannii FSL S10-1203]